ncbi:MAG TPA: PAS domain-containing sensor histidine kinase [Verrucomicrobiae bacterium]|jgi:PAS domain S-box-containing protein
MAPPAPPQEDDPADKALTRRELADFFEHAPMSLHWAGPDGRILKTNQAELAMLGYTREEYVGREAAAFHQDPLPVRAAMTQLARGEKVPPFESQLRCKDGSFKNVIIALNALRENNRLQHVRCFTSDITRLRRQEALSAALDSQLLHAARLAGMEEVASSVLHNVGNVLNSLNVSALTVMERVSNSRLDGVARVAELVRAQADHLDTFFAAGANGNKLPDYLETLARYWSEEQSALLRELKRLTDHVNHIKDVVSRHQSLTGLSGHAESASISDLIEDALTLAASGLERLGVSLRRDCAKDFALNVDRRKFMLILVNLITNARDSVLAKEDRKKEITVRGELLQEGYVRVDVIDNGVGIPPENLDRIFARGFTTKKLGHGFGLHSSALAARDLGGSLTAQSGGPDRGAIFTVKIPQAPRTMPPSV